MVGVYRVANLSIRVTSLHDGVDLLCASYGTEDCNPSLCVATTQADIDCERRLSEAADESSDIPIRQFSDAYLETLAVYRKIAERLPEFDALLVHGSCVSVDGQGYLFMANSGVGKSTHARLWREMLGSRAIMVNDDKPIIRFIDGAPMIFGTPWDGKHRLSTNIGVPLRAIGFIARAEQDAATPVASAAAFANLLKHAYRPVNPAALQKTLELLDILSNSVSLWRLECTMHPSAARMSYDAMTGTGDVRAQ